MSLFHLNPMQFVASRAANEHLWTLQEAETYTRWLATSHYENFHVVSFLLPKPLHQDFYNVYAYCRWSDDLGDETGNPARSLELLEWWGRELESAYGGTPPSHPVFVALMATAARRDLPIEPFENLLKAFVQDQTVTRYEDWDDVFAYCVNSADPVGRLLLMLSGYRDATRFRLSDKICTGLQLANFWQDVSLDLEKGRIYLPLSLLRQHGVPESDVLARRDSPAFRAAVREAVGVARALFEQGRPLVATLDRRLALDIDLFLRGGLEVLRQIEAIDYGVLLTRPRIRKTDRARLLLNALWAAVLRGSPRAA
ncbi:MAG: squalene synthase HpnC [Bryobacterales bacterium]|nr:squalene synthase HpnC [Bryobacterales bacterium]